MWPNESINRVGRLALVSTVLAVAAAAFAAEPERLTSARAALAKAKAALAKAQAEEAVVAKEFNARDMARAATQEIVVAARATLERAKKNLAAAAEVLKQKTEAARAARAAAAAEKAPARQKSLQEAAAQAAAQQQAAEKEHARRAVTARGAAERLAADEPVAERALQADIKVRILLDQKRLVTRDASRRVQFATAIAARETARHLLAEKATLEKALTAAQGEAKAALTKSLKEKAPAVQAALAEADRTETVVKNLKVTLAQEGVQAALGRKAAAAKSVQQKAAAARTTAGQVAAEKDPQKKQALQQAAAKARAEQLATEKALTAADAALQRAYTEVGQAVVVARGGLAPLPAEAWDYARARHLLVRAGLGGTPELVARLHAMGLHQAVDFLVDFQRQPAGNFPLEMYPPERAIPGEPRSRRGATEGQQITALRLWWTRRLVESPRPLEEKLTLFWHGHFAAQYSVVQNSYTMYQQNQLFRQHAAGNFGGLLYGLVHDPAMIRYLDNNTNVKGRANENLAREIMELFAMGEGQGYTEKDIREAARALTGYTFDSSSGQFRFLARLHDDQPKTIFGKTGHWTGDDLVELILQQPATARFISSRLFQFFAHDNPSPQVIDQLAQVLRSNQYELTPVLKNLFLSEEFYSERAMGSQIKSPVQLIAGMLRDLGVKEVADPGMLFRVMSEMGQELLEPPDVKGWRGGRTWINSTRLFSRYNTVANLLRGVPLSGGRRGIDVVALLEGSSCQNSTEVVEYLTRACLVLPLEPHKRQELIAYLGPLPPRTQWAGQRAELNQRLQGLLVLMLSIPEYQMT
ncbi:MAG: DUF1800 family protein [Gemmataceae bacterium]|nr:DUF1800 family protein [Gemmataceae bacterium]